MIPNHVPNVEETKIFWSDIRSVRTEHNQEAERLKNCKNELENDQHLQERAVISPEKVTKQVERYLTGKIWGKLAFKVIGLKTLAFCMNGLLFSRKLLSNYMFPTNLKNFKRINSWRDIWLSLTGVNLIRRTKKMWNKGSIAYWLDCVKRLKDLDRLQESVWLCSTQLDK